MKNVRIPGTCLAVAAAFVALTGCGDTKCKTDTECPLPQVCVAGACVMRSMDGTVFDTTTDSVIPDGTDPSTDIPVEGDVITDVEQDDGGGGPCTPAFISVARAIWGVMTISAGNQDDPDRPNITTLADNSVWVQSRIHNDPTAPETTPKLVHREVNPRTANASSTAVMSLGSVELDRYHETVPFTTGMASVFRDVPGFSSNQIIWQLMPDVTNSSAVIRGGFTNSDTSSSHPALAASDTQVMAVWRQDNGAGLSSLRFGIVDSAGTEVTTGVVTGDDTEDLVTPALAFNGTGYGLAYVARLGAGADQVRFVELNANGTVASATPLTWTVTEATSIIPVNTDRLDGSDPAAPALIWNGTEYFLAFEEASATGTAGDPSHLHTKIIAAGGGSVLSENTIEDDVASAATITVTGRQEGMLDVAWNGDQYGMVWIHEDTGTGTHVWFLSLDTEGALVTSPNSPRILNQDATQSFHPAITWFEGEEDRWFVFVWNEFRSSSPPGHVTYTYSYGCCWDPDDDNCQS